MERTVLLMKLTAPQLANKFPTFYSNRRYTTPFTSARHMSVRWGTKESVQVWGLVKCFITSWGFTMRTYHLAQPPSWRTTPCRLSATAYSIYSQLPSISEAVPPSTAWGRATLWWLGPTYHDLKCWIIKLFTVIKLDSLVSILWLFHISWKCRSENAEFVCSSALFVSAFYPSILVICSFSSYCI